MQPFSNDVVTQTLTGAQIKQALEEQWQPDGASRPLLHLGVSKGLTYSYDAKQPRGQRIIASSLKLNGVTLNPTGTYRVTTNSFLAARRRQLLHPGQGHRPGDDRRQRPDHAGQLLRRAHPDHRRPAAAVDCRASWTPPRRPGTFALDAAALWPGQTVTLTQTALADDVSPAAAITRVVTWGDGSAPQTLAAGATTATHTYPAVGSYQVSVALTDEAGNTAAAGFTGPSTVVVAAQPGRYALDTKSIWAGQSVKLSLSGVSSADKVSVAWGDGAISTMSSNVTSARARLHQGRDVHGQGDAVQRGRRRHAGHGRLGQGHQGHLQAGRDLQRAEERHQGVLLVEDHRYGDRQGRRGGPGPGEADRAARPASGTTTPAARWVKTTSKSEASAKAAVITVTPSAKGAWSLGLKGVKKGTLTVTYWGSDKVGNTSTGKSYTKKITK